MSTDIDAAVAPAGQDGPPFRYDAALAAEIERRWQDRWEREGTFFAPNPVGSLRGGVEAGAGRPKVYGNDMFS
jgi:leucyl-tRNA synthetase